MLAFTACGDDSGDDASGSAIDSVKIETKGGEAPKITWDGKMEPEELETEVLVEGDGEETASGDNVLAQIWMGNGFTQTESYNSYQGEAPQILTLSDDLGAGLKAGLEGRKIGSVVAVAAPAKDAFGEQGNPDLGIGNGDSVLFVLEVVGTVGTGPEGEEKTPAKWTPELVEEDGKVTGLDFAETPKPNDKLWVTKLVKGDGPVVKKGQTIYVNYLGQVYKAKAPFDESYSRGTPTSFPIGVGQVVPGWDQSLVGQTVGSRVVVAIPPALGYGDQGQPSAGIKGTDTLFFVVDILGAV
jgi:peptidylprolyl isomerase